MPSTSPTSESHEPLPSSAADQVSSSVSFTVKQVSALTGVPATTLRAWERRYGVVSPGRSTSSYRLYDQSEVDRLQVMAALVRRGTPARIAAVEALSRGRAVTAEPERVETTDLVSSMVHAARELDAEALHRALEVGLSAMPFDQAADTWLLPALAAIGEAWAAGDVDVAGEHFASGVVMARLGSLLAQTPATGPKVLVGLPAGGHHVLGSLCFAICLRGQGVDAIHLGADVPTASWKPAISKTRPAGVTVSVALAELVEGTRDLVNQIGTVFPDLPVWVGGAQARSLADSRAQVLPDSVSQAAAQVAAAVLSPHPDTPASPGHRPGVARRSPRG